MPKRTGKLCIRILPLVRATLNRPDRDDRVSRVRFVPVVALALVALNVAAVAGAQEVPPVSAPRAALASGSGAPGGAVLVVGEGWPAASVVQVQLCGNEALNGLADCLRSTSVTQVTDEQGNWNAELPVLIPPKPCPCVVYVTTPSGSPAVRLPFEVVGVPTATPQPASASGPSAAEATVGNGSESVSRPTSVTSSPWRLVLLIALLVVGLVAAGVMLRVRRRRSAATWGDEPGSRATPVSPIPTAPAAARSTTIDAAGATGGPLPPTLDTAALEEDLAEELGRAIARSGAIGPDDDPDLAAGSIAAEVAAVVGARHHLDLDAVEDLASDLRESLASELRSVISGAL